MRKLILIALLAWQPLSFAEPPQQLTNAVNAYKNQGVQTFISGLLNGSPVVFNAQEFYEVLVGYESICGKFSGIDVVRETKVTPTIKNTFFVMNYEKCPRFGFVTSFKSGNGEVITEYNISDIQSDAFSLIGK